MTAAEAEALASLQRANAACRASFQSLLAAHEALGKDRDQLFAENRALRRRLHRLEHVRKWLQWHTRGPTATRPTLRRST